MNLPSKLALTHLLIALVICVFGYATVDNDKLQRYANISISIVGVSFIICALIGIWSV